MEDLSDLTWSDTAAPAAKPAGKSAFDYLSAGGRYTPSHTPPLRSSSGSSANARPPAGTNSPKLAGSASKDDAFSSLFESSSSHATTKDTSKMSMAERLAAQRSGVAMSSSEAAASTLAMPIPADFGSTGSRRGSPTPFGNESRPPSVSPVALARTSADPWDFDIMPPASGSSPTATPAPAPATPKSGEGHARNDSWGISFSGTPVSARPTRNQDPDIKARELSTSLLGDSDDDDTFGSRRDGAVCDPHDEGVSLEGDDDILGALGHPIDEVAIRRQAEAILSKAGHAPPQRPDGPDSVPTGRASPPPHVLGQVVEMGFGVAQARLALLRTRGGGGQWNVEAAVGSLVGGEEGPSEPGENRQPSQRARHDRAEDGDIPLRPSRRRPPAAPSPLERQESTTAMSKEYQEQAAVILAQASAYGNSALGKASAFWKQGKASLAKALEEREASSKAQGETTGTKPKWMRDAEQRIGAKTSSSHRSRRAGQEATFKDDDDTEEALPQRPQERVQHNGRHPPQPRSPSPDLLGTLAPSASHANSPSPGPRQPYVSSARRRVAERTTRVPSQPTAAKPVERPVTPQPCRPPRHLPTPSTAQSSTSAAHKARGNESFKRGQFGEAETAYTAALDSLPEGCWEQVVVWNNRAMARLKNGDGRGAGEDATLAISLICATPANTSATHVAMAKLDLSGLDADSETLPPGSGINLKDQLGKALSRRAKAAEAREKWAEAAQDWEAARGAGEAVVRSAGGAKTVSDGVARCKKLADGGSPTARSGTTRPPVAAKRPVPRPAKSSLPANTPSAAVTALRNANEAAEAEASEQLAVKDGVDAKLLAWKGGKENNLRALIASLENVLWDGLGWKKVGMGELLSGAQVKSKYVRAISKVHPDKIPKDATTEQQMIAKGVFAALNEAWIAAQG